MHVDRAFKTQRKDISHICVTLHVCDHDPNWHDFDTIAKDYLTNI